ncbi:unnamed protein product [Caenorhabditis sp. 36 PRJEB53466]|nr:unnamed protein product [Caenorhabditis sp. 36 PRJEB53466]
MVSTRSKAAQKTDSTDNNSVQRSFTGRSTEYSAASRDTVEPKTKGQSVSKKTAPKAMKVEKVAVKRNVGRAKKDQDQEPSEDPAVREAKINEVRKMLHNSVLNR